MKQGNYLRALNCTLRIKDCGRTWLGGKKGKIKIRLQEVHCNIHHADRPLNRALPAPVRAALAAGAGGKQRQNGGELGVANSSHGVASPGGSDGVQGPPGSYVWVTAPRVQNGDSGFAGYG